MDLKRMSHDPRIREDLQLLVATPHPPPSPKDTFGPSLGPEIYDPKMVDLVNARRWFLRPVAHCVAGA
jgi:hypothetical protein